MTTIILTGAQKLIDKNYDLMFALINRDSVLPAHMNTSQREYSEDGKYFVVLKSVPTSVLDWAEQTEGVELN